MRKASHGLLSAPAAATPGATEKQERRASVLMRQHLMFFNEADVDGDSALDFDEFVAALPENVRTAHPRTGDVGRQRLRCSRSSGDVRRARSSAWRRSPRIPTQPFHVHVYRKYRTYCNQ